MTAVTFNAQAFALFVSTKREQMGLTVTEAAASAGVTRPQFFRAARGQPVNIGAFLTICLWLDMNPYAFALDARTGRGTAGLPPSDVARETSTETRASPHKSRPAQ